MYQKRAFLQSYIYGGKWLLCCSYNPHKNQILNHLKEIGKNIDAFSSNYDNLILLGDFNVEPTEKHMKDFSLIYHHVSIIPDRYHSIPIFISDRPSVSIGTDFFRYDFHKGEELKRSDSESDTRHFGQLSIRSKNLMETHVER